MPNLLASLGKCLIDLKSAPGCLSIEEFKLARTTRVENMPIRSNRPSFASTDRAIRSFSSKLTDGFDKQQERTSQIDADELLPVDPDRLLASLDVRIRRSELETFDSYPSSKRE